VEASNSRLMSINVGSPLYMPYESLHEKKFSTKSDIFALGVIWYELLTGKTPFDASSEA
jgi:serine/threonine protein kinase